MKKIKTILLGIILLTSVSGTAFSQFDQFDINDLQKAAGNFADDFAYSIPFYSTQGLNWSDAYIGKLFPSLPPHFGIGVSGGFTSFGKDSFDEILNLFGGRGVMPGFLSDYGMPMPAYTVEGRIGGFILPFDVGVKFGKLPLDTKKVNIDYLLIGADIRYGVIDNPISPIKLSIGLGYNHLSGGIGVPLGNDFEFDVPGTAHTLQISDPNLGFLWETHCFELKGQLSFKLPIVTPYAGTGISLAFSEAGYEMKTKIKVDGNDTDIPDEVITALNGLGISGITKNGFKSITENTGFNMRLFGGISFNPPFVRIDLTGMYNLTGGEYGASLGLRFQM